MCSTIVCFGAVGCHGRALLPVGKAVGGLPVGIPAPDAHGLVVVGCKEIDRCFNGVHRCCPCRAFAFHHAERHLCAACAAWRRSPVVFAFAVSVNGDWLLEPESLRCADVLSLRAVVEPEPQGLGICQIVCAQVQRGSVGSVGIVHPDARRCAPMLVEEQIQLVLCRGGYRGQCR